MTIRRRRFIAALLSFVFLALPACAPEGADLAEATWVLDLPEEWGETPAGLTPTEVTLEFLPDEGTIKGTFAFQKYTGSYEVEEDVLAFITLGWTSYSCMAAAGSMPREQQYLLWLGDAQSYSVDGDTLTIDYGDKSLMFHRK